MENQGKSFWKKNEGKITIGILGLLGLASLNYIDKIIATLLNIATNSLLFMLTLGGIAVLLFLVTNKDIRAAVSIFWQVSLRKALGWAIEMDPIAILKTKIDEAFKECENIKTEIKNFRMEIGKLERRITENVKTAEDKLQSATYMEKQGEMDLAQNASNYAARLLEMNSKKLEPLKNEMENAVAYLERLRKNLYAKTERTKQELDISEIEFNTMKSGRNAINSALRAYQGNPDRRMIYEMTAEHLESEIGKMMGEIKSGVEITRDFMKSSDLENGSFNEKGLKTLQNYKEKGMQALLTPANKDNQINLPIQNAVKLPAGKNTNTNSKENYQSLLD